VTSVERILDIAPGRLGRSLTNFAQTLTSVAGTNIFGSFYGVVSRHLKTHQRCAGESNKLVTTTRQRVPDSSPSTLPSAGCVAVFTADLEVHPVTASVPDNSAPQRRNGGSKTMHG
jgi:hypothetical protein